jgi:predicted TIM-barrel fold metal-dependent hydrolase
MIIDEHAHSAGEFYSAENVVRILDDLEVDKVVLCPGPINGPQKWPVPDLTGILRRRRLNYWGNKLIRLAGHLVPQKHSLTEGNAYVASMAEKYPERIVQAYWVDPTAPAMVAGLDRQHRMYGFRVLKVHQCFHRFSSDGPEMRELAHFACERNLPLFFHHYSRKDADDLLALVTGHPGTTFIIGHLLGLDVFMSAEKAKLENVYFDISPPNLIPEFFVHEALGSFGAARLLLGSDTPYGRDNLKKNIERVLRLDIPDEEKRLILGGNMQRLLNSVSARA